ncbi:MAG: SdiA-regulated domain-containing protein [Bacteroidota bacterium]
MPPLVLLVALVALVAACNTPAPPPAPPASVPAPDTTARLPYDLAQPDARFALDERLREISGLGWTDTGRLVAVQDEDGDVFELDPESGAVLSVARFANNGDYEGIEVVDSVTWIVESDGDLYPFDGTTEANKIETELRRSNDVEGLAFDPTENRLLLACKEDPGGDLSGVRAIYAYDLASGRLGPDPVYTLDRATLDPGGASFKPSGLAVHPETGEIYVVSGVRQALVVLSPTGDLRAAVQLPAPLYPQPEGIAFAPDGTLYISNEGTGGPATLLRFLPHDLP